MFPVLTDAIFWSNPLDYSLPAILSCLFFVTSRGVPQSITLLNLLSIGFSSALDCLLTAEASTFFLVWGANNDFFSSAIRFCFSVSTGSSLFSSVEATLPLFYSWACLYRGLFWMKGTSLITCFVGFDLFRSWSLQYSSFQSSLISIISSWRILVHSQLLRKMIEALI